MKQTPKRPRQRDPDTLEAAAARMIEGVREKFDGLSDKEITQGLRHAFARSMSFDGYEIARRLEQDSLCDPDAELVEMLDSAYGYVSQAHNEAVKRWVSENNITLLRKVGDRVKCRHGVGVINEINAETAIYLFKPDGSAEFKFGGGIHVTDEELEDAPAEVA